MANFAEVIKRTAMDAVAAGKPMNALYGLVESTEPLVIAIEPKLSLTKEFLILTEAVRDYEVEIEVDHETETAAPNINHNHTATEGSIGYASPDTTHKHEYKGRKKIKVLNGLKENESVILLQEAGGQRFIVLCRKGERDFDA